MVTRKLAMLFILACCVGMVGAQEEPEGDKTLPGEEDTALVTTDEPMTDDQLAQMLRQGTMPIDIDALIEEVYFNRRSDWENYEEEARSVAVQDGVYIAQVSENNIIWGQNEVDFSNGIVEVVAVQDEESIKNNGYGILCRADPKNTAEGYHFWVSGEGDAAILLYDNEDYTNLTEWQNNDAILTDAPNLIHAVCVDNYLALYVNRQLIAEVEDDTFQEGVTGLTVFNFEQEVEEALVRIEFDNLRIWEAQQAE